MLDTRLATRETLRTAYAASSARVTPTPMISILASASLPLFAGHCVGKACTDIYPRRRVSTIAHPTTQQSQPRRGKMESKRGGTIGRDARDPGLIYQAAAGGPGDTIEKLMFILLRHTNSVVSCCVVSLPTAPAEQSEATKRHAPSRPAPAARVAQRGGQAYTAVLTQRRTRRMSSRSSSTSAARTTRLK